MARRRRERMSEGKKNIIAGLIQEYDIKTAEDIQEALKDLLDGTIPVSYTHLDVYKRQVLDRVFIAAGKYCGGVLMDNLKIEAVQ